MTNYILPYSAFCEKYAFFKGLLSVVQGEDRSPFPRQMKAEFHTLQFGRSIGLQTGAGLIGFASFYLIALARIENPDTLMS